MGDYRFYLDRVLTKKRVQENYALRFDGVDDYCVSSIINYGSPTEVTIETSFKPTNTLSTNSQFIWTNYDNNSNAGNMLLINNSSNRIGFHGRNPQYRSVNIFGELLLGQWNHVAAKIENGWWKIYINGIQVIESELGNPNWVNTSSAIGRREDTAQSGTYFDGEIRYVRVWGVALSDTKILENSGKKINGHQLGMIANYNMNADLGCTLVDESNNNNDMTLMPNCPINSPEWIQL